MNQPIVRTAPMTVEMRCPTCNAQQAWSDECRRCKCDLSLLHRLWRRRRRLRDACLRRLRAGRPAEARAYAEQYRSLSPDDGMRLLAVCHLLSDNWTQALREALRIIARAF
jgi:hypothetical protein